MLPASLNCLAPANRWDQRRARRGGSSALSALALALLPNARRNRVLEPLEPALRVKGELV